MAAQCGVPARPSKVALAMSAASTASVGACKTLARQRAEAIAAQAFVNKFHERTLPKARMEVLIHLNAALSP